MAKKHPMQKRMDKARKFMSNTCPASRHAAMAAETMLKGRVFHPCTENPEHIGGSVACTVAALWEARTFLIGLGYRWRVKKNGKSEWVHFEDLPDDDPVRMYEEGRLFEAEIAE